MIEKLHILAQSIAADGNPLFAYGPLGIMCAWLMWRGEKLGTEIRSLSHRIDGITRAMLVDVIDRDTSSPTAKKIAQEMLTKIEARSRD